MSNLKKIGNKLFKEATELKSHEVELGLVDKLESRYKSLGKNDVGSYLSSIQKMTSNLKSSINKVGDLKDEIKAAASAYKSMGDTDNANLSQRLLNDIQNDFDELVFVFNKLKSI